MMISSFDGARLHVTEMGEGRPLLLLHGFISNAQVNWIDYGTAAQLVDAGFHLIMPDLRGHGRSDWNVAYPLDVLRDDMVAVLDHFALQEYDLAGYSLGARTAARVAALRAPRKLILSGMGKSGLIGTMARRDWFIAALQHSAAPRDAAEARVASFLKSMNMPPEAAIAVMQSQGNTSEADLAQLAMPTLVLAGAADSDNGSAPDLAAALPHAHYVEIPGTHMSAVTTPDFGAAIRAFLGDK
jgi:pimeloyl-ACP methyl ester carboxylesterase